MTLEILTAGVAVLVSLAAAYVPRFSDWYAGLSKQYKALFMLASALVYLAVIFGLSCAGYVLFNVACSSASGWLLVNVFIQFAIANQAAYLLGVRSFKSE